MTAESKLADIAKPIEVELNRAGGFTRRVFEVEPGRRSRAPGPWGFGAAGDGLMIRWMTYGAKGLAEERGVDVQEVIKEARGVIKRWLQQNTKPLTVRDQDSNDTKQFYIKGPLAFDDGIHYVRVNTKRMLQNPNRFDIIESAPADQAKGHEPAKKSKAGKHPFVGRLVAEAALGSITVAEDGIKTVPITKDYMSYYWGALPKSHVKPIGKIGVLTIAVDDSQAKGTAPEKEILVLDEKNRIQGIIWLSKSRSKKEPWRIRGSALSNKLQGKGLMPKIYAFVVNNGIFLQSDYQQSPGGAQIWAKLADDPTVTVYGARKLGNKWEYTNLETANRRVAGNFNIYQNEEAEEIDEINRELEGLGNLVFKLSNKLKKLTQPKVRAQYEDDLKGLEERIARLNAEKEEVKKRGKEADRAYIYLLAVPAKEAVTESVTGKMNNVNRVASGHLLESNETREELKDWLASLENEMEEVDDASQMADEAGKDISSYTSDYHALHAVEMVVRNHLNALRNPVLLDKSIFLYNIDADDQQYAGLHIVIDGDVAVLKWLGNLGERGVGSKLLRQGMEMAKARGAKRVKLTTKWNSEGFYQKAGFKADSATTSNAFSDSSNTEMSKTLESRLNEIGSIEIGKDWGEVYWGEISHWRWSGKNSDRAFKIGRVAGLDVVIERGSTRRSMAVHLADRSKDNLTVGEIQLDKEYNAWITDISTLSQEYQGRGIMLQVYVLLCKKGLILRSGSQQSAGGEKLWLNLSKQPGITVYAGYEKSDGEWVYSDIDNEDDDRLRGGLAVYDKDNYEVDNEYQEEISSLERNIDKMSARAVEATTPEDKAKYMTAYKELKGMLKKAEAARIAANKAARQQHTDWKVTFLFAVADGVEPSNRF